MNLSSSLPMSIYICHFICFEVVKECQSKIKKKHKIKMHYISAYFSSYCRYSFPNEQIKMKNVKWFSDYGMYIHMKIDLDVINAWRIRSFSLFSIKNRENVKTNFNVIDERTNKVTERIIYFTIVCYCISFFVFQFVR